MTTSTCDFERLDGSGNSWTWKCRRCGFVTIPFRKAPLRRCSLRKDLSVEIKFLACPHRREVIATIRARSAGCGCAATRVEIYRCDKFNEPVLKQAGNSQSCLERITLAAPGYTGRTCLECKVPMSDEKPKPKPKKQPEKKNEPPFDVEKHLATFPYHPLVRNIAAVTCHFNPQRSRSRIRCYETFVRQFPRIGLDLFTAEGSVDGCWEIPNAWRYRLEAELFAKENLLNLAIARLPDQYDRVLWIDSDVLMLDSDYADKLSDALDRHTVVQAFAKLRYLRSDGSAETGWRSSLMLMNSQHNTKIADATNWKACYPGLAWATTRELLTACGGIYDRVITGGGDNAWAIGVIGDFPKHLADRWSDELGADIKRWGAKLMPLVKSVGHVETNGVHLYHGKLTSRMYAARNEIFREVNFDPQRHLEYGPGGTLRWSAAAPPRLVQFVRDYIHGRKEDEP